MRYRFTAFASVSLLCTAFHSLIHISCTILYALHVKPRQAAGSPGETQQLFTLQQFIEVSDKEILAISLEFLVGEWMLGAKLLAQKSIAPLTAGRPTLYRLRIASSTCDSTRFTNENISGWRDATTMTGSKNHSPFRTGYRLPRVHERSVAVGIWR
jgi:hypothetical protein